MGELYAKSDNNRITQDAFLDASSSRCEIAIARSLTIISFPDYQKVDIQWRFDDENPEDRQVFKFISLDTGQVSMIVTVCGKLGSGRKVSLC